MKIARLEAELESARHEIDRLRARLADIEKDRKPDGPKVQSRYWTPHEHQRFLEALAKFGPKDVRAIASYVGSRNATQVRTHAQKYFLRVARERKNGSALQSARRRSMSESDLARVGRSVRTPPGSPTNRHDADNETGKTDSREDVANDDLKREGSPTSQNDVSMPDRHDDMSNCDQLIPKNGGLRGMRVASTGALPALVAAATGSPSVSPRRSDGVHGENDVADAQNPAAFALSGRYDGDADDDTHMLNGYSRKCRDDDVDVATDSQVMHTRATSYQFNSNSSNPSASTRTHPISLPPAKTVTFVSASKPPVGLGKVDTAGINLLSLVASERKMETESGLAG